MSDDLIYKNIYRMDFAVLGRKKKKVMHQRYVELKTNLGVFNFQGAAAGINVSSIKAFFGSSSHIDIGKRANSFG